MSNEASPSGWQKGLDWAWDNKEWIATKLAQLRQYLFSSKSSDVPPQCLIIGPGGVGKSTTARLLQGDYDSALSIPGEYTESVYLLPFRRTRALIDEIAIRKKAALRDGW